jgi:phosphomannomutase
MARVMPSYHMKKEKLSLGLVNREQLYERLREKAKKVFSNYQTSTLDGIKKYNNREWIHLRLSNTEPVLRIIAESGSMKRTNELIANCRSIVASL